MRLCHQHPFPHLQRRWNCEIFNNLGLSTPAAAHLAVCPLFNMVASGGGPFHFWKGGRVGYVFSSDNLFFFGITQQRILPTEYRDKLFYFQSTKKHFFALSEVFQANSGQTSFYLSRQQFFPSSSCDNFFLPSLIQKQTFL